MKEGKANLQQLKKKKKKKTDKVKGIRHNVDGVKFELNWSIILFMPTEEIDGIDGYILEIEIAHSLFCGTHFLVVACIRYIALAS